MKTNVKKLMQQVTKELKNKRTQKIMLWSLIAAVGFLIIVGIFSSLSSSNEKEEEEKTSEEQTSTQMQEEENIVVDAPMEKTFYVDFSQESTSILLATVNGIIYDQEVEIRIYYGLDTESVYMYVNGENTQLSEILLNCNLILEEGIAYKISLEDSHGIIALKQGEVALCLISVTPNERCEWKYIIPTFTEMEGTEEESFSEEGSFSEEESFSEEDSEESSSSEEETTPNESSSQSVSVNDEKISYIALFGDIVIAALWAIVLTVIALFIIIAVTKRANPISVFLVTVQDYSHLWKREQEEEYEEYDEEDIEEDSEEDSEEEEE